MTDLIEFAEHQLGLKLSPHQKALLLSWQPGSRLMVGYSRRNGLSTLRAVNEAYWDTVHRSEEKTMNNHTAPPGLRIPRSHPFDPPMTPEYYAYTVRLFNELIWWKGKQLTAGCSCRDVPRWYPGRPGDPLCSVHGARDRRPVRCQCWPLVTRMGEPPEVEQNPDCPLHWAPSYLVPCTCEYRKKYTRYALPPTRHGVQVRLVVHYTYFLIDPDCHWHGDDALPDSPWGGVFGLEGEAEMEPPAEIASCSGYIVVETYAETVLDEHERHD